ncbi:MAG: hypothetical protein Q9M24_02825 [Mariprofundaceae bacterium]|nr:hypothetical protein [Mariprofundaceae bacterium]
MKQSLLAGVDEVGRGTLAGPVVTAALILSPDDPMLGQYRDSKKVSAKKRIRLLSPYSQILPLIWQGSKRGN